MCDLSERQEQQERRVSALPGTEIRQVLLPSGFEDS